MRPVSREVRVGVDHADRGQSAAVRFFDGKAVITLIIAISVIGRIFFRVHYVVKSVGKFRRRYFVQFDVIEKYRSLCKVRVDAVFKIRAVVGVRRRGGAEIRGAVSQPELDGNFAILKIGTFDINFIGLPILLGVYRKIIDGSISANYDRRAVQRLTVVVQQMSPDADGEFIILPRLYGCFVGSGKVNRTFIRIVTVYRNHQSVGVGIFIPRFGSFRVYAGEIYFGVDLALSCIEGIYRVLISRVAEKVDYAGVDIRVTRRKGTARRDRPTGDIGFDI